MDTVLPDLAAIEACLRAMADVPGEAPGLSELDHALQCAERLREAAPDDEGLQIAGLVHDIGHNFGGDEDHPRLGAAAVRAVLGARIAALVALHVEAKRYLVTTDPRYANRLSDISAHSLILQGGAMTPDEAAAFAAEPYAEDAVRLRQADEAAKVVGARTAGLAEWLPMLRRVGRG
jgi:predicted HD phosphohydrolase